MFNEQSASHRQRAMRIVSHRLTIALAAALAGALVVGYDAATSTWHAGAATHGKSWHDNNDTNHRSTMIVDDYPIDARIVQTPSGLRYEQVITDDRFRHFVPSVRLGDMLIDTAGRVAGLLGSRVLSGRGYSIPSPWSRMADGELNYKMVRRWSVDCEKKLAWHDHHAFYLPGETDPYKVVGYEPSKPLKLDYAHANFCVAGYNDVKVAR